MSSAAEKVTDLTGADAKTFKAHVDQTVSQRGVLEIGKQGLVLMTVPPQEPDLYIQGDRELVCGYQRPADVVTPPAAP